MLNNVMIDLETLGTNMNAPIISIGAVFFNPETGHTDPRCFLQNISIQSVLSLGFTPDETIEWWLMQDKEVIKATLANAIHFEIALMLFNEWLTKKCEKENLIVWGNGAKFDLGILTNAFKKGDYRTLPWEHWNERCVRTIAAQFPAIKDEAKANFIGTKHNPVDDCLHQIKYLVKMLNKMK